ncbi:hypothetical protein CDAR_218321 [Caerostris darwini]|uniref:Uncharacterized protein n=1 Tax=Caerostris darwini TaxID=1538125 RepID=A0AAV4R8B2_9ARAC|nr:hypothetical protein CDAR_218321 [Caerostris darwini]
MLNCIYSSPSFETLKTVRKTHEKLSREHLHLARMRRIFPQPNGLLVITNSNSFGVATPASLRRTHGSALRAERVHALLSHAWVDGIVIRSTKDLLRHQREKFDASVGSKVGFPALHVVGNFFFCGMDYGWTSVCEMFWDKMIVF